MLKLTLPLCLIVSMVLIAACSPSVPRPTATVSATPTAGLSTEPAPSAAVTVASLTPQTTEPQPEIGAIAPLTVSLPAGLRAVPAGSFAVFAPAAVATAADVNSLPIAADLGNVDMTVILAPEQQARLVEQGFVISPGDTREFYELYERARYDNVPVFVSSDSLLHVYHLLFDKTLRQAERNAFIPLLGALDLELLRTSVAQYEALYDTPWADSARRNAAYFAVAVKLLHPDWPIPEGLRDLAEADLTRIAAHAGPAPSAIFPGYPRGEDWSQYVPRGHYTAGPELERYFRAMMWHGRMNFRVSDPLETRQAALLTLAYQQTEVENQSAAAVWAAIYDPTVFFVGRSDDLTPVEYGEALSAAYGTPDGPRDLLDEAKFAAFQRAAAALRPPQIMGMIPSEGISLEDTGGLRLMGQRFVPDAFIFQQLVSPAVPERGLPSSLDVFAALGSERALSHLAERGDTQFTNYRTNMDTLRAMFAGYSEEVWTQNLYWSWMHSLRPLLAPVGAGYPQFMQSPAWQDKQLTTALGSWTELKRDTILYAKQVYAERGYDSIEPPDPERPKGYVEPVPLLYARIAALSRMTIEGLESRGLLAEDDRAALAAMESLATRMQTMAEKQLRGETLSDEEYEFIRFYGAEIESLTFAASDESIYQGHSNAPGGGDQIQAAVVADLATNVGAGVVLENGVGRIFEIYVVAPVAGRLVLTKGGVFSHYEFAQPLGERLTDEAWRERLDSGTAPPPAEWTSSYLVEQNRAQPLETTIRRFHEQLVQAYWYTNAEVMAYVLDPAELAATAADIAELKQAGRFIGARLISLEFRSFDFQDADNAVVTTRERWSAELYTGSPYFEQQAALGEPRLIGVRPPYTRDSTYTMRRVDETWQINRIVSSPADPPDWQAP
jgi:hypothetical protein